MRYKCHVNKSPMVCWQMSWWEGDSITGYEADRRVAGPLCSCGCQQWYNGIDIVQSTIISGLYEWHEWWDMLRSQKVWIKVGEAMNMQEDCVTIQKYFNRLEKWADRNFMKFNTDKWKLLHLGWNNFMEYDRLAADRLENSFTGKVLRPQVDTLTMNQQYTVAEIKTNHPWSCIDKSIANGLKYVIILLCSALVKLHVEHCASLELLSTRYWYAGASPARDHQDHQETGKHNINKDKEQRICSA